MTKSSSTEKATKVAHVKAAKQERGHTCHWPGCGEQVPPAMWGCKGHWFKLPKSLRDSIWKEYRPGQEKKGTPSARYVIVAALVQEWIAGNVRVNPDGRIDLLKETNAEFENRLAHKIAGKDADREMLGSDAAHFDGEIGNK